jgi:gamma-glutamyltranspeptidase/glutathione hydrolase
MNAIAAGHPLVAEVAAQIIADGGNAVDAACAAALAACVAEPVLVSLGGGGLAMVADRSNHVSLTDFWIRHGDHQDQLSGQRIELDWAGDVKQSFMVGPGSVGVWRMASGLQALLDQYGSYSMQQVALPAIRLAESGVELNQSQAEWMQLLHEVHCLGYGGLNVDKAPEAGERFVWPGLEESLKLLAQKGASAYEPQGAFWQQAQQVLGDSHAQALARAFRPAAGISVNAIMIGEWQLYAPDLPSLSGNVVAKCLSHIDEELRAGDSHLALTVLTALNNAESLPSNSPSTSAISVSDDQGLKVSLVISNGSGSGVFADGVQLNNAAGEVDLRSAAGNLPSGMLPTRMCPIFARKGNDWVMLGSGGSERIASATVHTLTGLMFSELSLSQAIEAPRFHVDELGLQAEPQCLSGNEVKQLECETNWWPEKHAFFGGVNAVGCLGGVKQAHADSRRQGAALS